MQERADWSVYDSAEITFDQMRFGSPLDEVSADTDGLKFTSELFQQQVWLLGDTLGLGVDEVSTDLELLSASVTATSAAARCVRAPSPGSTGDGPAGVTAVAWSKSKPSGRSASRSRRLAGAAARLDRHHRRHTPMQAHLMTLASFRRDAPLAEHVRSASVATAMQAVNAIPAVCEARPGFVTMADLPLRLFG